jgi:hypothetical protein
MTQKLKLSKETVAVLKNFSSINPAIYFRKGNVISTITPKAKTIFARYEAPENFKSDFGLYRLDKMLSVLSFFNEPELLIGDKCLTVKAGNQSARLAYGDPESIDYPKKDSIDLPSVDAEFDITEADLANITKAYSVMTLPFVAFESDGEKLLLKALDYKNANSDAYTIELEDEKLKPDILRKSFTALFNISNLKLIPGDYHVKISAKGISEFSNDKLTYWVAVEKDSTFDA